MKELYFTKNHYFYSYLTSSLFKTSEKMSRYLNSIDDIRKLHDDYVKKNITEEAYGRLKTLIGEDADYTEKRSIGITKLQFIVNNYCNMNCTYCYANGGTYNSNPMKMTYETMVNAMDLFFEKFKHIEYLSFFGGEPLLNIESIDKICNYVEKHYQDRYEGFMMMSNLFSLSEEAIAVIKKHKIRITVSLDGKEEINDYYRKDSLGKGSYNNVSNNIIRLRNQCNQPEAIEATLSGIHNTYDLDGLQLAYFFDSNFGIKCSSSIPVKKYKGMNVSEYIDKKTDIEDYINVFIESGEITEPVRELLSVIRGYSFDKSFCDAGIGQYTVMPNGDIYPCQVFSVDSNRKFVMSNVNCFSIDMFEKVQNDLLKHNKERAACNDCEKKKRCHFCIANQLVEKGKFEVPEDCREEKEEYNRYIEYYGKLYANKEKWNAFKLRIKESERIWNTI